MLCGMMQLQTLSDWISPAYLDVGVLSQIQQQFEEESQIELPNFLLVSCPVVCGYYVVFPSIVQQEEKYGLLCEEMVTSQTETKWTVQGPPNYK